MPMREELYIPKGHPLDLARNSRGFSDRVLRDSDSVIAALLAVGLFLFVYLAIHFPCPEEMCEILMTSPY
jgi:hypothetical protein